MQHNNYTNAAYVEHLVQGGASPPPDGRGHAAQGCNQEGSDRCKDEEDVGGADSAGSKGCVCSTMSPPKPPGGAGRG